uniref:Uncharacterized protein n=1 Tax=Glossina brevipalpis TaxID=37001 RepID=A0A1A9X3R5_9MUSC
MQTCLQSQAGMKTSLPSQTITTATEDPDYEVYCSSSLSREAFERMMISLMIVFLIGLIFAILCCTNFGGIKTKFHRAFYIPNERHKRHRSDSMDDIDFEGLN